MTKAAIILSKIGEILSYFFIGTGFILFLIGLFGTITNVHYLYINVMIYGIIFMLVHIALIILININKKDIKKEIFHKNLIIIILALSAIFANVVLAVAATLGLVLENRYLNENSVQN